MEHIWTIENWEKNINLHEQGHLEEFENQV